MPGFKLSGGSAGATKSLFGSPAKVATPVRAKGAISTHAPVHPEWNGKGGFKPGNQYGARDHHQETPAKEPHFSGHPTTYERTLKPAARELPETHMVPAGTSKGDPVGATDAAAAANATKKTVAKAKKTSEKFPDNPHPSELDHFMNLGGSTGATLQKHKTKDELFVVKKGNNPGHIREESHADKLYHALGVPVPHHTLHETPNGPVKVASYLDKSIALGDAKNTHPELHDKGVKDLQKHFVADTLLGNWDVIGLNHDNVRVTMEGKAFRIDNGGSLRYRAQGEKKADHQFGPEVGEVDSMRFSEKNKSSKEVFGSITDKEVARQIGDIVKKKQTILDAAPHDLKDILGKRIDWLAEKRLQIHAKLKTEGAAEKLKAKEENKAAKKQETHQAKVEKFQSDNPGKPLPKSLAKHTETPESAFMHWGTNEKTLQAGDKQLQKEFKPWAESLRPHEKQAVYNYTADGYIQVNSVIWSGAYSSGHVHPAVKQKIETIEAALTKTQLTEPTIVFRGVSVDGVKKMGLDPDSLMPGQTFHMTGFKSTSLDPNKASSFAGGGIVFRILADKGTKGAYINGHISSFDSEKEFLLPNSTQKFRIKSIKKREESGPDSYSPHHYSHEVTLTIAH